LIRFSRLTTALLDSWLIDQRVTSRHARYRLRVWREDRTGLAAITNELETYFTEAFDDARRRIRRGFEDGLSPFNDPATDPAANYPALLHRITLQGYFGEILAIIAVEHWGAHGHADWMVPAFLFRLHDVEFQHLEMINERLLAGQPHNPDALAERRPGRTGDDGLAFRLNGDNTITDILTVEAKCVSENHNGIIQDAHEKLSAGTARPTGVRELVSLLDEYDTPQAAQWQEALLKLWRGGYRATTHHDAIGYACGRVPARAGRTTWMSATTPHASYVSTRNLECMEFQFADLPTIIDTLYRGP
jgi:hypothetical protein